jgi:hypothetical protein
LRKAYFLADIHDGASRRLRAFRTRRGPSCLAKIVNNICEYAITNEEEKILNVRHYPDGIPCRSVRDISSKTYFAHSNWRRAQVCRHKKWVHPVAVEEALSSHSGGDAEQIRGHLPPLQFRWSTYWLGRAYVLRRASSRRRCQRPRASEAQQHHPRLPPSAYTLSTRDSYGTFQPE